MQQEIFLPDNEINQQLKILLNYSTPEQLFQVAKIMQTNWFCGEEKHWNERFQKLILRISGNLLNFEADFLHTQNFPKKSGHTTR